jgi:hypothetical protein
MCLCVCVGVCALQLEPQRVRGRTGRDGAVAGLAQAAGPVQQALAAAVLRLLVDAQWTEGTAPLRCATRCLAGCCSPLADRLTDGRTLADTIKDVQTLLQSTPKGVISMTDVSGICCFTRQAPAAKKTNMFVRAGDGGTRRGRTLLLADALVFIACTGRVCSSPARSQTTRNRPRTTSSLRS